MAGYYLTVDGFGQAELTDQPGSDLMNQVYLSLAIRRGSWFFNPEFGSRLHLLQREKNLPRTEQLLKDYVSEALQWLYDTGRIIAHETVTERAVNSGRIKYTVTVTAADGELVTYTNFARVA